MYKLVNCYNILLYPGLGLIAYWENQTTKYGQSPAQAQVETIITINLKLHKILSFSCYFYFGTWTLKKCLRLSRPTAPKLYDTKWYMI